MTAQLNKELYDERQEEEHGNPQPLYGGYFAQVDDVGRDDTQDRDDGEDQQDAEQETSHEQAQHHRLFLEVFLEPLHNLGGLVILLVGQAFVVVVFQVFGYGDNLQQRQLHLRTFLEQIVAGGGEGRLQLRYCGVRCRRVYKHFLVEAQQQSFYVRNCLLAVFPDYSGELGQQHV